MTAKTKSINLHRVDSPPFNHKNLILNSKKGQNVIHEAKGIENHILGYSYILCRVRKMNAIDLYALN